MYIPKLMLLIFNFILLVIGLIALSRGLSDYVPIKLKPLERSTELGYFSKLMLFGGCAILFIAFLGFWGAEMENRTALITYKILLCFVIGVELIIILYVTFNDDGIQDQLSRQLTLWGDQYEKEGHHTDLENVQNYLNCCEVKKNTTKTERIDQKTSPCDNPTAETCSKVAYKYFTARTKVYLWFLANTVGPEIASIIFADMVAKKILMLQNIMLGKLGSS